MSSEGGNGNGKRKPPAWVLDDEFKPVQAADVSDIALLPRRFDLFSAQVRQSIDSLIHEIRSSTAQIKQSLDSIGYRIGRLEHDSETQRNALQEVREQLPKPRSIRARKRK
jgi:hypothetical protein